MPEKLKTVTTRPLREGGSRVVNKGKKAAKPEPQPTPKPAEEEKEEA